MSKRYSIDEPILGDDEIEEDIVLGSFHPTDRDRDLLLADEEILNTLQKKSSKFTAASSPHNNHNGDDDADGGYDYDTNSPSSRFFSGKSLLKKYKKLASESSSSKKKVGFASDVVDSTDSKSGYAKLNDYAGNSYDNSGNLSSSSSNRPLHAPSDSDSEDYDSDIEIDIHEGLSRSELRKRTRKLHGVVLLFIGLLIVWLLYNNSFPFHFGSGRNGGGSHDGSDGWAPRTVMSNGTHEFKPTTLVVSLDGFHPHYVSDDLTPNLHTLMTRGGGAPYMTPSFPSSTFPNHWSMVTGLYPANHGIVGNTFWDEKLQKQFFNIKPGQSLDRVWWGGQPVWVTGPLQGVRTAVHMWPGSEAEWNEVSASGLFEWDKYNGSEILENKTKRVFGWLDREIDTRPELILTYVPTVDVAGHTFGIAGDGLVQALKDVDTLVGELVSGIAARNLTEIVNVVVVSDHGMAPTSNERLIYLEELVELSNLEHIDGWPLMGLRPKPSLNLNNFYNNLKEAQKLYGKDKWDVYLREELPAEWKFGGKSYNKHKIRIAPLWLIPKVGWSFTTKEQMDKLNGVYKPFGVHGYNNTEILMRALFLAQGPYFTPANTAREFLKPFDNVGLYNIMCWSLGIKPASNDAPADYTELLQQLPENWTDAVVYPNLPFSTEILKVNSTYDAIFGDMQAVFGGGFNAVDEPQPVPESEPEAAPKAADNKDAGVAETGVKVDAVPSSLSFISSPSASVATDNHKEEPAQVDEEQPEPTPEVAAPAGAKEDEMEATSTVDGEGEEAEDSQSEGGSLKDWFEYFKDKAHQVSSWVGEKIEHLKGNKNNEDKETTD